MRYCTLPGFIRLQDNISVWCTARYSEATCPLAWWLLRIFTRMLITVTMSYLISISAWRWLLEIQKRHHRHRRNIFRHFIVELRRPRNKNLGIRTRTLFRYLGESQGRWTSPLGWMMSRDVKLNIYGVFVTSERPVKVWSWALFLLVLSVISPMSLLHIALSYAQASSKTFGTRYSCFIGADW
jgi:hypothetical protein